MVRNARLSALDANLRVHLTLTRQFESEEAIQDAKTAALRAFQRNLHTEANQSTLSSGGWRHEDADRIRRVTRHAQHTMARQLQSGEAARAAIVSAICANRMARLTLSQQLEHRENIREGHTSVPVATRGAEEPRHRQREVHRILAQILPPRRVTGTGPLRPSTQQVPGPAGPGRSEVTREPQHLQASYLGGSVIEQAPQTDLDHSIEALQHKRIKAAMALQWSTPRKRRPNHRRTTGVTSEDRPHREVGHSA